MRLSFCAFLLVPTSLALAGLLATQARSQEMSISQAPTARAQTNPSLVSCPHPPCDSTHPGTKTVVQTPHIGTNRIGTPEEQEEKRLRGVFSEIKGQEQAAQRAEATGDLKMAAYWRNFFAGRSGLSKDQAEAVKAVAAKYESDSAVFQAKLHATTLSHRRADANDSMSRSPSPQIVALQEERNAIFANAKSDLVQKLESKGFAQLDSYALHRNDNMKRLKVQGAQQTSRAVDAKDAK